jgi:peptide/nickel transport system permease protein
MSFYLGLFLSLLFVMLGVLAPWLPIANPNAQTLSLEYIPPSAEHWFGCASNGVDLLSQLVWGARLSLGIGVGSVLISASVGLFFGSLAGYFRGWTDFFLLRIMEILNAFPGILLVVTLSVFLGPSILNIILVFAATSWVAYAKLVRGLVLSLRERDFVQASRASGASDFWILFRHIWPNCLNLLVVQMSFGFGSVILGEAALGFLGLGAPPGTPSWGSLLNEGRDVLTYATHVVIFSGTFLVLTVLGFNLLGDGLRDRLDPRVR